ncbi:MAG TPA: hypothetical protein VNY73_09185 [Bacteroidia bacterium]|jgi:hypothetical protein|nr:hypothetical protein [Bacteroidia bacterium]
MDKAEDLFKQLAEDLNGVKEGKMFGALCLKTPNGKSGAMFWKDCIVVKLQGDAFKEALALKGARLFEPMEGRPMKEWVQVPYAHKDKWKKYAELSVEGVKKLKK